MSQSGAYRFGIARVEPVDDRSAAAYDQWIAAGRHDTMDYLDRYADVRRDPSLLLEGARSMIVAAFPYAAPVLPGEGKPPFCGLCARRRLSRGVASTARGGCRRSASAMGRADAGMRRYGPLRERYWAVRPDSVLSG